MIFGLVATFFFVANPVGNTPAILACIKDLPFDRQKKVMLREAIIAFLLAVFFAISAQGFFHLIVVKQYTISITGGVLLLLVALSMIFPPDVTTEKPPLKKEPFIVPIATPLISGPGLLSIVMLKVEELGGQSVVLLALCITWIGVTAVLLTAPFVMKIFGRRGMIALEQLMGMIVSMLSMQMILNGVILFSRSVQ